MNGSASLAPAKLNLFLYVIDKRDDGYHNILTLMQKVSLYDRISVSVEQGSGISMHISGFIGQGDPAPVFTDIPLDEKNTAFMAARLFFQRKDIGKKQVDIVIEKHIPVQSGMGGASSDAACVLKTLNRLIPEYNERQLYELSKQIGSDVPFFMVEGAGLASGRGDIVRKVEIECPFYYVVIKPDFGIATKTAYSRLKILTKNKLPSMCDLAFYTKDAIMRCLQNDLEMVTGRYAPEIKAIKEKLLSCGAKAAMMTGSGSCIFGIFYEEQEAEAAYNKIATEYTTVYKLRGI